MANIFIVEDDESINELIRRNLILVGHNCIQAYDGKEALTLFQHNSFDLILLDVMLPSISGFELLPDFVNTPVIFITAKGSNIDKIRGLTSGAEDYIVKPFDILELIARINIVLRRNFKESSIFIHNNVTVDFHAHTVFSDGRAIYLTPKEFDLLEILIHNRNIALSREKLLELAWGYDYPGDTRTVDVHIQRLRKKLAWEDIIKTVYKMGYRLGVTK